MNKLLRPSIAAKSQGVLPPRAQRAVKHASARTHIFARSGPRHPVLSLLLPASLRSFSRVDDWRGGGPAQPDYPLRFQSPLGEPDVRISRIRLSPGSCLRPRRVALARTGVRGATTCWALVGLAVDLLAAHRVLPAQPLAWPITVPSAVRSLTAAFAAPAPPPVCRYILDFLLRFHMWCLAELLDFSAWPDAKRQSPVARSCQHRSRTKGPSLHQHYPASPVLRPYPPPQGAGSVPHDTTVGQHRLPATPRGFPCCTQPLFHTCRRHYPGGTVGCPHRSLPQRRRPSPKFRRVGFRIALFEACSAFTARYGLCACQVPTDPLHQKLRPVRYLHGRSDCYRLERHLPGGIRTH